jgi:HK97 family phage major capsid protein
VSDGTDWEYEEELPERPFGPKPFGPKPFGPKPFGPKPFGPKPFGPKPFGPKPFGPKPFGPKDPDAGFLDRDAWSADIAELVCERSAVIRLGATIVTSDEGGSLPIAAFDFRTGFRAPGKAEPAPGTVDEQSEFRPGEWRLTSGVALSPRIQRAVAARPELADALKADLAEALAREADQVFLQGSGSGQPQGITKRLTPKRLGKDPLQAARQMVTDVRKTTPTFRNPGWIMGSATLDELTKLVTRDGLSRGGTGARSLDSDALLQLDGMDGGAFLGFPFLISAGAGRNVYFAADWDEAWIGLGAYFVSVYVSAEPLRDREDRIVIRASMPLDFALRDPAVFACATG